VTAPDSFSEYIVYVDESGDHGLDSMDMSYPMFVLAFCLFRKEDYVREIVPALQRLKFKHFGHDLVVLHEREMRKQEGPFQFLVDRGTRASFMDDVSRFVEQAPFTVIAAVIDKGKLKAAYADPRNPYHWALEFCVERLRLHLGPFGSSSAGRRGYSWRISSPGRSGDTFSIRISRTGLTK